MEDLTDILDDPESGPSAQTLLKELTTAWVNEKNAPELLKYATEAVDFMMIQIEHIEENLPQLSHGDFRLVPHQMEVNRIRFILASYHRCRLEKIEMFAPHLYYNDLPRREEDRLMSPGEFDYAHRFVNSLYEHFFLEAYRFFGDLYRDDPVEDRENDVTPNLNSSVFIRMLKLAPNVLIGGKIENLEVGSRHLLPYKDVSHLIKDGSAALI